LNTAFVCVSSGGIQEFRVLCDRRRLFCSRQVRVAKRPDSSRLEALPGTGLERSAAPGHTIGLWAGRHARRYERLPRATGLKRCGVTTQEVKWWRVRDSKTETPNFLRICEMPSCETLQNAVGRVPLRPTSSTTCLTDARRDRHLLDGLRIRDGGPSRAFSAANPIPHLSDPSDIFSATVVAFLG
jgi:hypothetical protein